MTTIELMSRNTAGDIVILAVPYAAAVDVVTGYGDALTGKILIDITDPFNATLGAR